MPLNLTAADRKLLYGAGGVFLLIILLSVLLSKGNNSRAEVPTTYSTASGGAKAAYLLLHDSGYKEDRWEHPLSDLSNANSSRLLSNPADTTLIIAEPTEMPGTQEREGLRKFLENGGHLVVTGMYSMLFLPEGGPSPDPVAGMTWKQVSAIYPSAITRAAPQITLSPQAYWGSYPFALRLYGDKEKAYVVKYKVGKGEILWWASATPLTNAGLKEPGNLEFFLACAGDPAQMHVLWDEYVHGYRQTLAATVYHSPAKWMFLQFGLLALAIVATYSRRSGPICLPASEGRLSPLEFVRTLGLLYEKAGAASVAVDISYQRFRYWVAKRLGMANNAPSEELCRAIRERWGFDDSQLAATLQTCEAVRYDTTIKSKAALNLVLALYDYSVKLKLFGTAKAGRSQKN